MIQWINKLTNLSAGIGQYVLERDRCMLYVSPAKIASYFYHECERNFYFQSLAKERRSELDVPEELFEQPAVHESVLRRGVEWGEVWMERRRSAS